VRRSRPLLLLLVALTLVGGTVLGGCSKDDGDVAKAPARPTTTSTTALAAPPTIGVTVTGVDANGTKAPDDATVAAVKATLDSWLATAVVAPLFSGQPAGDLSGVFTPAALERLAADPAARPSLVDDGLGLPPASTAITAERANVALASVAGPDEVVAVIAAQLDILLRAQGPTVDVDVNHHGEVVLVPDGGTWKIDAFSVTAARDSRA
jgi:hypothetical protein